MTAQLSPPLRSNTSIRARLQLDEGHGIFVCAVALSLFAAQYLGPVIAIILGIGAVCAGALSIRRPVVPPVPMAACWLIAIFVVGLASSVVSNTGGTTVEGINLERDLGIVVSYTLFMVAGYFFAFSRSSRRLALLTLVFVGTVISIVHTIQFGIVVSGRVTDLYLFRLNTGRGSVTQYAGVFACAILLGDPAMQKYKSSLWAAGGVSTVSVFMTLSRGLILDLVILGIIVAGFTVQSSGILTPDVFKLIRFASLTFLGLVAFYLVLLWIFPSALSFLNDVFITKLTNSLTEVSSSDLETRKQIAENYRAFELDHVISTFNDRMAFAQWFGQGWGSTLKFGLETAGSRSDFSRTEAPFLHNGYAYYAMKTGIAGLVMYLCFLVHLATRAVSPRLWTDDPGDLIQRKVLLACSAAIAIDTVASGGLGFPASYLSVIFLVGICYGPVWGPHIPGPSPELDRSQTAALRTSTDSKSVIEEGTR